MLRGVIYVHCVVGTIARGIDEYARTKLKMLPIFNFHTTNGVDLNFNSQDCILKLPLLAKVNGRFIILINLANYQRFVITIVGYFPKRFIKKIEIFIINFHIYYIIIYHIYYKF